MPDPKLKAVRVRVAYTADDGYESETVFAGTREHPEAGLIDSLEGLARLAALFGFDKESLEAFNDARSRVAEWRAAQVQ